MQIELIPLLPGLAVLFGLIKWLWSSNNRAKVKLNILKIPRRMGVPRFDKSTISTQAAVFMEPKIKDLNNENPEISLPLAKIEFSKTLDEITEIKDGQLHIRLRDSLNEGDNLVRIAEEYVREGVMKDAQRITETTVKKAVDLTITHRLIERSDEALRIWHKKHYQPLLSDDKLRDALEKTTYVDKVGYLTRLFIPELELVARRLGYVVKPSVINESQQWLDFIYPIAQKCDEDPELHSRDVNLVLRNKDIAVGVVYVARSHIIAYYGTIPHERWIHKYLEDTEINDVFVLGHGTENCYDALRLISRTYLNRRIVDVSTIFYHTRSRGRDNVPIIIVRYVKSGILDEPKKRKIVQKFLRTTQKELPRVRAKKSDLISWCNGNIESIFGKGRYVTNYQCGTISNLMNEYGFTVEELEGILDNREIEKEYEKFLVQHKLRFLLPHEEILYKLHVAGGVVTKEIGERLSSHLLKNHGIQVIENDDSIINEN